MDIIFIVLTVISLIALILGFFLFLIGSGKAQRRSGEQVGAQVLSERMEDERDPPVAQAASFKGKASRVEGEASVSFVEIKDSIVSGNWRQALPVLLATGGMIGLMIFGSLTLFLLLEDKFIGGVILLVAAYTVIRLLINIARA